MRLYSYDGSEGTITTALRCCRSLAWVHFLLSMVSSPDLTVLQNLRASREWKVHRHGDAEVLLPFAVSHARACQPVPVKEWDTMAREAARATGLAPDRVLVSEDTGALQVLPEEASVCVPCVPGVNPQAFNALGDVCYRVAGDDDGDGDGDDNGNTDGDPRRLAAPWRRQLLDGIQPMDAIVEQGWIDGVDGSDGADGADGANGPQELLPLRLNGSAVFRAAVLDSVAALIWAAMGPAMLRRMPTLVNTIMGFRVVPERFGVADTSRNGYAWRFAQWACGADDVQWGSFSAKGFRERRTSAATQLLLYVFAARCGVTRGEPGDGAAEPVATDGAGGSMSTAAMAKLTAPQFEDVWAALQDTARSVRAQFERRRSATCFSTENVLEQARAFLAAKPPDREFQRYGLQGFARAPRLFQMCVPVYEDQAGAGATNARARAQGFAAMKRLSMFAAAVSDFAEDLEGLVVAQGPGGAVMVLPGHAVPNRLFEALAERVMGGWQPNLP
jgi:hypothetical protein